MYNVNGISDRYPVYTGHIAIPSDVDRDEYIKFSHRSHTVCVRTRFGEFIKHCPISYSFCGVNDGFISSMDYPEDTESFGSQVLLLGVPDSNIPIVIGCMPYMQGNIGLEEEHQMKIYKNSSTGSYIIEGRGLDGIINLLAEGSGESGAKINLSTSSSSLLGEIKMTTNTFSVDATQLIKLQSREILELLIKDVAENKNFTSIKYERGVGFTYADEFGHAITITDGQVAIVHKDGKKIEINTADLVMNGGGNGGLAIVSDLVDQMNATEDKVNEILNILKAVVIPLAPTGAYPFAPLFTTVTPVENTQESDIENEDVKH